MEMSEDTTSKSLSCFQVLKDTSYSSLAELAEISEYEAEELHEEHKLADYSLYKVLKHGTCSDYAEAMQMYVKYVIGSTMASLLR
jgi:predicted transcriptional regulator